MANNITNAVTASITATEDSSGSVIINRAIGTSQDSTFASGILYQNLGAGTFAFTLLVTPVTQFYFKNLDPAKSVSLAGTPNGGISATLCTLNPGDFILYWAKPSGTPASSGYTAFNCTPSAANCLIEYFIGG